MKTLAFLLLLAQESPEAVLYKKCGSQIPWITDGLELADGTPNPPIDRSVDRLALLERAKSLARQHNRLLLWYCMRVPGTHTYRAAVLDTYMRVGLFTDPGLVDLINAKFIPLRMACDDKVSAATGVRFPGFVEPGLILLTPEGRVIRTIDRLRTFSADQTRAALIALLHQHEDMNAPVGDSVQDLIRGGDDEKALERATADQKAVLFRHAGRFREVLGLPCAALHQGIARLALGDALGARKILEKEDSPEALYHLAALEWWSGKDPEVLWRRLVEKHPESPWAWRAASNLVQGRDGVREGPLTHEFEALFVQRSPEHGEDFEGTVRRAVEFLLRAQREDGSWSDTRYSYGWAAYMIRRRVSQGLLDPAYTSWPDVTHHPNVFVAITSLAATALLEWREEAPERIDRALARAERYIADDGHLAPGCCEECFAETYRLLYFARRKDAPQMNRILARLAKLQDADGFWGHEYPSAFATAGVVHVLRQAREAGADVPDSLLHRATDALLKTRHEDGRQDYRYEPGKPASSEKNSMGRTALCELALHECAGGSLKNVARGVDSYWKHLARLEAVRSCDNHADEELAGFFYFYSVFHTLEAARALAEPLRSEERRKFRAQILSLPEPDGSFVDSHEIGKSYGTAMALLVLRRTREEPPVVDLWPGAPAGDVGISGEEKFREIKIKGKAYEIAGKPTKWLTNVSKPTLTIYRPPKEKNTGVSMIICPGGGYHNLGWDVEGEEVAEWLNSVGMTGIILKYRCPRRRGESTTEPAPGPLKDAQRAVSLVRANAKEWGIDPSKIGMVGFSAGGHLVGATATNFETRTYEPVDEIDKVSCRPDFAVSLYAGYYKVKSKEDPKVESLSPTIKVTSAAPPLMLVHATDDPVSDVEHSIMMFTAMKRAGVKTELHVYASGGHGFGVRKVGHPCETWTDRCLEWLRKLEILK